MPEPSAASFAVARNLLELVRMKTLNVHFLPSLVTSEQLTGSTVVVIDVLRASTTIVHALAAGAKCIVPCLEVEQARRTANASSLLCGERNGLKIDGFDLGNSPSEFTSDRVSGKVIVFTTTNGTKAMMQCRQARRVLIGAFVNIKAIFDSTCDDENVDLLCAGTDGEITGEDVYFAGAMVHAAFDSVGESNISINDQARVAVDSWIEATSQHSLVEMLSNTRGGRNLTKIGLQHDIDTAAMIDRFQIVPELKLDAFTITTVS